MSGDIGLEPLALGTHMGPDVTRYRLGPLTLWMHMGPDVTRHRPQSLATRCEPMLHVAKTDVTQDSKTKVHCLQKNLKCYEHEWIAAGILNKSAAREPEMLCK